MKILVAGDYSSIIYARALNKAFRDLGYDTAKFDWHNYFSSQSVFARFQYKYHVGPTIFKLNKDLVSICKKQKPDLLFVYRGIILSRHCLEQIRNMGIVIIGYNNDDPFDIKYPKYVWKMFLGGVKEYNLIYSFRWKNIEDYKRKFGIDSELLRIYYIAERNYQINDLDLLDNKYKSDVIFIGHFEDDGRDEYLIELIRRGINFKLYGSFWDKSKYYSEFLAHMGGTIEDLTDDYNLAMNSAKIALVFLSKLNNDTYTTRCFEIPATKTFMLCEYSDDMASMFEPEKEAAYFTDKESFLEKVYYYIDHDEERTRIAENGYSRVMKDGHEVKNRALQILDSYNRIIQEHNRKWV